MAKSALVSENVAVGRIGKRGTLPGGSRRLYFIPEIGEEVVQGGISYLLRSAHPREPITPFLMQEPDSVYVKTRLPKLANFELAHLCVSGNKLRYRLSLHNFLNPNKYKYSSIFFLQNNCTFIGEAIFIFS